MSTTTRSDLPTKLQKTVRRAIEKHGLERTAKSVGIGPVTLQRFAFTRSSHAGTVALVEKAVKDGKIQ